MDRRAGHEELASDRVFGVSVALEIVVWKLGHNILLLVDLFDRLFCHFLRVVRRIFCVVNRVFRVVNNVDWDQND